MKLTRGRRIALELLGPAAVGAFLASLVVSGISIWEVIWNHKSVGPTLREWGKACLGVLLFAYFVVGLQSIAATVIMELCFKDGLTPGSWRTVKLASLLGFLSGEAVGVLAIIHERTYAALLWCLIWGAVGLLVGFILGLLIKFGSAHEKEDTKALP